MKPIDFKRISSITLWSLMLLPGLATGQAPSDTINTYQLTDRYPAQSLDAHTWFYQNPDEALEIEDLIGGSTAHAFRPVSQLDGAVSGVLWLRVTIQPEIDLEDWWLILKSEGPRLEYLAANDQVAAFFVQGGTVVRQSRTGMMAPASERAVPGPATINRVPAHFQAGIPTTVYLRLQDDERISYRLELRDPAFALPAMSTATFISIDILRNSALILGIYVLCFFFYVRDWSYLYLFGCFACLFLHYNILDPHMPLIDWLFPEHPQLLEPTWILLTMGSFIFFLQFGRTFVNLKRLSPFWDRIAHGGVRAMLILLFLHLAFWILLPNPYPILEMVINLLFALIPLVVVVRLAFFRDSLVRHFVFGAAWLLVFTVIGMLWNRGLVPFFEVPNPWVVAQGGFMLIYALALARKIQISERAKSEVEKVKEIDSVKSRFFANISHEFRTPLSLILGPVNQSLEAAPASDELDGEAELPVKSKYLKVIKRNALRLQQLIDQILDLSQLDRGKMELQVARADLITFLRAIIFSFESLAERQHIHFRTHFPQWPEEAWFDRDKLEKILVNLLSNAFKFTPEHGEVAVQVTTTGPLLRIAVSDTGSGLPADEAEKIFERFYQTEATRDQGTGIGLSLVKELVELHRGQIKVDSTEGAGTTFTVMLPYRRTDFQPHELSREQTDKNTAVQLDDWPETAEIEKATTNGQDPTLPLLLVVEDNTDLRRYISEQLSGPFRVLTAPDGRAGLALAEQQLPDLIISDVMMPGMNGIELCTSLKSNVKTSHIPVILLTARAGQEAKIQGLETGADAYLTKPFDGRELRIRATQLIEQRQRLREKFAGELRIRPKAVQLHSMDEQFLQQVMDEIEKNMDNEYYSVEELAGAVGFSRSQLNRKLKGLIDKSPNQLIREFRLTRAKELLEQKVGSVSEIAFQVGYSNLSYFSRTYKEAFGVLPSETGGSW